MINDIKFLRIEDRNWPVEDAAEITGCGRTSFYSRFIATKQVRVAKIGRRTVIPGVELKRLIGRIAKGAE